MELVEVIKNRRSIRAYKQQKVPEKVVEKLIEAARFAPSAGNIQPWKFVIIRKSTVKKKLAQAASQAFIEEAPVVMVICADEIRTEISYGSRGKTLYCIQDTAAATQNLLLTACDLGLGTCWVGAFNENQTRKAVNAPEGMRPVAIIPIGYPNEIPIHRSRRSFSQVVRHECF